MIVAAQAVAFGEANTNDASLFRKLTLMLACSYNVFCCETSGVFTQIEPLIYATCRYTVTAFKCFGFF